MNPLEITIKELIRKRVKNRNSLDSLKRKIAKDYKISCPSNVELLSTYHKLIKKKRLEKNKTIERLLCTRPIRSLSGIVNVSVLTKSYPCPGECIFCPTEKGIPKSYLKGEPAVQRAILNKFNPFRQIQTRLKSLEKTGHPIDKIELRIIGGTWSYYPKQYQSWFIRRCFQACNKFSVVKNSKSQAPNLKQIPNPKSQTLETIQKRNEGAKHRIIGITIETRPDFITKEEIKRMRELGITRVELGVQSIYEDVLKKVKRGHGIKATIKATKFLKDAGFKVSYQMMPNLPGSDFKRDVKMFGELFSCADFQPDLLKIYPLALVKQSSLYQWYRKGKYKPYSEKKLIKLLFQIKKTIPYYCRIERIIRDIPSDSIIEGGTKTSNLREVVLKELEKRNLKCKCIRCREVKMKYNPKEKLKLFRQDYNASGGKEIFLSFEDKKRSKLYALLRLRIPSQQYESGFPAALSVLENAAIIRELHTYGQQLPFVREDISDISVISPQHKGLGKKLIKTAEKIVYTEFSPSAKKERKLEKMAVISGVGARHYFKKLGYKLKDTYMIKKI